MNSGKIVPFQVLFFSRTVCSINACMRYTVAIKKNVRIYANDLRQQRAFSTLNDGNHPIFPLSYITLPGSSLAYLLTGIVYEWNRTTKSICFYIWYTIFVLSYFMLLLLLCSSFTSYHSAFKYSIVSQERNSSYRYSVPELYAKSFSLLPAIKDDQRM